MPRRDLTEYELESMRRSLAMLQTNQLALTRDQAVGLLSQLIEASGRVRELEAQLADPR